MTGINLVFTEYGSSMARITAPRPAGVHNTTQEHPFTASGGQQEQCLALHFYFVEAQAVLSKDIVLTAGNKLKFLKITMATKLNHLNAR